MSAVPRVAVRAFIKRARAGSASNCSTRAASPRKTAAIKSASAGGSSFAPAARKERVRESPDESSRERLSWADLVTLWNPRARTACGAAGDINDAIKRNALRKIMKHVHEVGRTHIGKYGGEGWVTQTTARSTGAETNDDEGGEETQGALQCTLIRLAASLAGLAVMRLQEPSSLFPLSLSPLLAGFCRGAIRVGAKLATTKLRAWQTRCFRVFSHQSHLTSRVPNALD